MRCAHCSYSYAYSYPYSLLLSFTHFRSLAFSVLGTEKKMYIFIIYEIVQVAKMLLWNAHAIFTFCLRSCVIFDMFWLLFHSFTYYSECKKNLYSWSIHVCEFLFIFQIIFMRCIRLMLMVELDITSVNGFILRLGSVANSFYYFIGLPDELYWKDVKNEELIQAF